MKPFSLLPALVLCLAAACPGMSEETIVIPLDGDKIWSRTDGDATLTREPDGVYIIENRGPRDWAVPLHKPFQVTPGEIYRVRAAVTLDGDGEGGVTVALRDEAGEIVNWSYGSAMQKGTREKATLADRFIIPHGGATLEPRIVGSRPATVRCEDIRLEKIGTVELRKPTLTVPESATFPLTAASQWHAQTQLGHTPQLTYSDQSEFKITPPADLPSADASRWELSPPEPIRATPGERFFVSLWLKVEQGTAELAIHRWKNGFCDRRRIGSGTFRPSAAEEGGVWCNIHAYVTVPAGVEGFLPVLEGSPDAVVSVAKLEISRPTDAELNPVREKVTGYAKTRLPEKLDCGLVAIRTDAGVYLSWRLLETDAPQAAFDVYRVDGDGNETKINTAPITATTDFLDTDAPQNGGLWCISTGDETSAPVAPMDTPYISIPLRDATSFIRFMAADLDGDGRLDYVIRTPNSNIDPYINYWKPSPGTYKMQAYRHDGTFLWEVDLGWNIEQGIWYSPALVADLDGDGRAEIALKTGPAEDLRTATGRVYSGDEYLTILDGTTGKPRLQIPWPSRDGLPYNLSSRNQLCLAYLDGKTPCLIVQRGTYSRMTAVAYQMLTGSDGDRLEELWRWDNRWDAHLKRWGQGAHTMHAYDLDGDGRDEVMLGSITLDDDGSILWETQLGHPDHMYLGDLDPERPGLEILYGIETRQPERNGVCMVDARTGEILWGHDKPTTHIHSTGLCADIDARHPGCEIWSGERDSQEDRWLRDAKGNVLDVPERFPRGSLAPKSVWWDADLQREMIVGNRPLNFPQQESADGTRFGGSVILVADILGDWREEVVTSSEGEIRIYTTTIPARDRRVTFLQDRNYRATFTESMMGYPQIPLPAYDVENNSRERE